MFVHVQYKGIPTYARAWGKKIKKLNTTIFIILLSNHVAYVVLEHIYNIIYNIMCVCSSRGLFPRARSDSYSVMGVVSHGRTWEKCRRFYIVSGTVGRRIAACSCTGPRRTMVEIIQRLSPQLIHILYYYYYAVGTLPVCVFRIF